MKSISKIVLVGLAFSFTFLTGCTQTSLGLGTLLGGAASQMSDATGGMGGFADASDSDDESAEEAVADESGYYIDVEGNLVEIDGTEDAAALEELYEYESASAEEIAEWYGTEESLDEGDAGYEDASAWGNAAESASGDGEEADEYSYDDAAGEIPVEGGVAIDDTASFDSGTDESAAFASGSAAEATEESEDPVEETETATGGEVADDASAFVETGSESPETGTEGSESAPEASGGASEEEAVTGGAEESSGSEESTGGAEGSTGSEEGGSDAADSGDTRSESGATDEESEYGSGGLDQPVLQDLAVTMAKQTGDDEEEEGEEQEEASQQQCSSSNVGDVAMIRNAMDSTAEMEGEETGAREATSSSSSTARRSRQSGTGRSAAMVRGVGGAEFGRSADSLDTLAFDIAAQSGGEEAARAMKSQFVFFPADLESVAETAAGPDNSDDEGDDGQLSRCEEIIDDSGAKIYIWVEMGADELAGYEIESGSFGIEKGALEMRPGQFSDTVAVRPETVADGIDVAATGKIKLDAGTFGLKAAADAGLADAKPYIIVRAKAPVTVEKAASVSSGAKMSVTTTSAKKTASLRTTNSIRRF